MKFRTVCQDRQTKESAVKCLSPDTTESHE